MLFFCSLFPCNKGKDPEKPEVHRKCIRNVRSQSDICSAWRKHVKETKPFNIEQGQQNHCGSDCCQQCHDEVEGINYRLNTTYEIKDDLRKWKKVDVKYIERHNQNRVENFLKDEDGDCIFFYEGD